MNLGALLTPLTPIPQQAQALEAEGFDSIWSAQAMGRGFMMSDPFVALAAAASVTQTVELGTAILQIPLYNPTDIALKAISLNRVSQGRFLLGVGAGSTQADHDIHKANFESRLKDIDRSLGELRGTLLDGNVGGGNIGASNEGPPLLYGTWGKNVARAATEFDGWIASGMHRSVAACCDALQDYRQSGGQRAIVSTILVNSETDTGELKDALATYADAGFDDAVLFIQPGSAGLAELRGLVA